MIMSRASNTIKIIINVKKFILSSIGETSNLNKFSIIV